MTIFTMLYYLNQILEIKNPEKRMKRQFLCFIIVIAQRMFQYIICNLGFLRVYYLLLKGFLKIDQFVCILKNTHITPFYKSTLMYINQLGNWDYSFIIHLPFIFSIKFSFAKGTY